MQNEDYQHLTWKQLAELIDKMSEEHKNQTAVFVDQCGSDVFAESLKMDRQGNPYVVGF